MNMLQLHTRIPVKVTAASLPSGVTPTSLKGDCIAWWWNDENHFWLVVFDDTGETVWVPQNEIKVRANWSAGRRYGAGMEQ